MDTETQKRIAAQRIGGKKLGRILDDLLSLAKPGVSLATIEDRAQEYIKAAGGTPSFQTVEGYRWATCLCINEDVVHGIPTNYLLEVDDVLTIDVGILFDGYHTDTAWTKRILSLDHKKIPGDPVDTFLAIGEKTLWEAIGVARVGNHIGHISLAIQEGIEEAGYSVVKSLVGHTVGKELHEMPQVPGYVKGPIEKTPKLVPGMSLAIEIIYAEGKGEIVYSNNDGWTLTTKDGTLSGTFEHTVLITEAGPEVLTKA